MLTCKSLSKFSQKYGFVSAHLLFVCLCSCMHLFLRNPPSFSLSHLVNLSLYLPICIFNLSFNLSFHFFHVCFLPVFLQDSFDQFVLLPVFLFVSVFLSSICLFFSLFLAFDCLCISLSVYLFLSLSLSVSLSVSLSLSLSFMLFLIHLFRLTNAIFGEISIMSIMPTPISWHRQQLLQ